MRSLVLLVVVACGPTAIPVTEKVTVPTNQQDAGPEPGPGKKAWKVGPGDFPIPGDADDGTQMTGNLVFQIPRPRDVVHQELVKHITANGYTLDDEALLMGGYRMQITRSDGRKYSVSVSENDDTSTLMQVSPK